MVVLSLGLAFTVVLILEWRYRVRTLRVACAFVAVAIMAFAGPRLTTTRRRALDTPPAERVTQIGGMPVSEYAVGVLTMSKAVAEDARMSDNLGLLSLGVLLWLACSPAFRPARSIDVRTDARAGNETG